MKRNMSLLSSDLDRVIKPNIALLRQCGLSVRDIADMCSRKARMLTFSPERTKEVKLRVEELGIVVPRRLGSLKHTVSAVANTAKETNAAKLEFLKSTLDCSKSEIATAVSKVPSILRMSEDSLLRKIQFMINEAGLEPQYILGRPVLLTYSLEKRLVPRHCLMKVLLAKGLLKSNLSFSTMANIGEKTFRLKFIDSHKDSVTGLADAYSAARGGGVPPPAFFSLTS
ncbi:hypothetical protein BAE44_0023387 [Dichanthelium oligosanthes]|uniref:Uncharacterized protein n=1 Tax=Dichanthelium oligosanthes TaxID=888268 RepID=A0A1E5URZ4_9POAL|nr:hypothetical protein BAE44_0023387 [Dichanthelium oligosanthes]